MCISQASTGGPLTWLQKMTMKIIVLLFRFGTFENKTKISLCVTSSKATLLRALGISTALAQHHISNNTLLSAPGVCVSETSYFSHISPKNCSANNPAGVCKHTNVVLVTILSNLSLINLAGEEKNLYPVTPKLAK